MTDSTVGDVSLTLFKTLFSITEPIFKTLINVIMGRGINFEWILEKLGIDFIVFEKTLLEPQDGYAVFKLTPSFNLDLLSEKSFTNMFEWLTSEEQSTFDLIAENMPTQNFEDILSSPEASELFSKFEVTQ